MQSINSNFSIDTHPHFQSSDTCSLKPEMRADLDNNVASLMPQAKILVVEDEGINQIVARMFLNEQGYKFDIASSGEEALKLFTSHDYAAILMDIGLPGIDGLETTRRIRVLEQGSHQHTPIIALTANGIEYKEKCLASGMDDFSVKPFEFNTLSLILKKLLESKLKANKDYSLMNQTHSDEPIKE